MDRVYNFSPAPATLPREVLEKAREDMLNYKGLGISVAELQPDTEEFSEILTSLESAVRELLCVPDNYKILLLQGGARSQYAAIPLNLLSDRKCADYIISGPRSRDAYLEAKKYGDIVIAASSGGAGPVYNAIPETTKANFRPDSDYVYMCYMNSTSGTEFNYIPDTGNIPLVADMTGFLFSEPIDVSRFGLIFASSEANFGIAGLTLVIVRNDLIGRVDPTIPSILNYRHIVDTSLGYDVPPVFDIYVMKLTLDWMISIGGLEELKRRNERKASLIYDELDRIPGYTAPVAHTCRSMIVIRFHTSNGARDEKFIEEARQRGLVNLGADKKIGGMRVALYNYMPIEGVEKLCSFIRDFAEENMHSGNNSPYDYDIGDAFFRRK